MDKCDRYDFTHKAIDQHTFISTDLKRKFERLEIAVENLLQDVRFRYEMEGGEEFHCPFMRELEAALKDLG